MSNKKSIKLSYLLRHSPESANLIMNENGWVSISMINENTDIDRETIFKITEEDSKNRYEISVDKLFIRARQGHSIPHIEIELIEENPSGVLYHGTTIDAFNSILSTGKIIPMSRNYVHLTDDLETAISVANRRKKKIVILELNTEEMIKSGFRFYKTSNNVWHVTEVPLRFIKLIIPE